MAMAMLVLAVPGILLLFLGPVLARLALRRSDSRALARVLQAVGAALIVGALLVRPVHRADDRPAPGSRGAVTR